MGLLGGEFELGLREEDLEREANLLLSLAANCWKGLKEKRNYSVSNIEYTSITWKILDRRPCHISSKLF